MKPKTYTLTIPEVLYRDIEQRAQRHRKTTLDLFKSFIRLGLVVDELKEPSGIYIHEPEKAPRKLTL